MFQCISNTDCIDVCLYVYVPFSVYVCVCVLVYVCSISVVRFRVALTVWPAVMLNRCPADANNILDLQTKSRNVDHVHILS